MVSACMCMYHVCLLSVEVRSCIRFRAAGAVVILSHHMGAQNQTWTLRKTYKCS